MRKQQSFIELLLSVLQGGIWTICRGNETKCNKKVHKIYISRRKKISKRDKNEPWEEEKPKKGKNRQKREEEEEEEEEEGQKSIYNAILFELINAVNPLAHSSPVEGKLTALSIVKHQLDCPDFIYAAQMQERDEFVSLQNYMQLVRRITDKELKKQLEKKYVHLLSSSGLTYEDYKKQNWQTGHTQNLAECYSKEYHFKEKTQHFEEPTSSYAGILSTPLNLKKSTFDREVWIEIVRALAEYKKVSVADKDLNDAYDQGEDALEFVGRLSETSAPAASAAPSAQ